MAGSAQLGFTGLDRETRIARLPTRGRIPPWLAGTLIRNGPARFEVGGRSLRHWFDGFAMLHAFAFAGGEVAYSGKFLRTHAYTSALRTGKIGFPGFATDPCRALFRRVGTLLCGPGNDNANVSVGRVADRFLAFTETPLPIAFDPRTLETLGVYDYHDRLAGALTTAHPQHDAPRHATFSYLTQFGRTSRYHVYYQQGRRRTRVARLTTREPAYMHSFAMTERFVVLMEYPLVVRPFELLLSGRPFADNLRWAPERGTRFFVIDKSNGTVTRICDAEPCFAFHHVNAFERGDELLIDVVVFPDAAIVHGLQLDALQAALPTPAGELRRYRVPLWRGPVAYERLTDTCLEMPRIDEACRMDAAYRCVYGVGAHEPGNFVDQLVKVDLKSGAARAWRAPGCYPGEPIFVRAPQTQAEDAGVVLSVVLDAPAATSFLLVLDAASFEEIGRATVPHHIPFGFHGEYFADVAGSCT